MSYKIGRPQHEFWDELGFTRIQVDGKEEGKFVYKAKCWQCDLELSNTAGDRLKMHRNRCPLDVETIQNHQTISNHDHPSSNKRKARNSTDCSSRDTSTNSVVKFTNRKQNKRSVKPKLDSCISKYIDELSEDEISSINEAILEYFIVSRTDFNVLASKAFINLIQRLRPAFKAQIPSIELLTSETLDQVYLKKTSLKSPFKSCGVLLIKGDSNGKIAITYDSNGQYRFLQHKSEDDLNLFINTSIEVLEERYSSKIRAVVCNVSSDVDVPLVRYHPTDDEFHLHITCTSNYIFSCIIEIVSPELLNKVLKLNATFNVKVLVDKYKLTLIEFDVGDYSLYYTGMKSCLEHLHIMCGIVSEKIYTFDSQVLNLLFQKEFSEELRETVSALESLDNILKNRSIDYKLADLVQDWFNLINNTAVTRFKTVFINHGVQIFNGAALAANYLHPNYRGSLFAEKQYYLKIKISFLIEVSDGETMDSFFEYRDKGDSFELLFNKLKDKPKAFWQAAEMDHKKLARLALRLLEIPAFTYHNKILTPHYGDCQNEIKKSKISQLYYLLKIND